MMKKHLLLLSIVALTMTAAAQDKKTMKCDDMFSGIFGINLSGIGGDSESYSDPLMGLYIALGLDVFCLTEEIKFKTEVAFTMQGSKYEGYSYEPGGGSNSSSNSLRLNYLALPLTAQYRSKKGITGEAGIQPAILLSAKDKHNGETDDIKDDYNGFDMGLVLGVGYRPQKGKIGVGLRFVPGLTNINKEGGTNQAKDHNWNASLRLSYAF